MKIIFFHIFFLLLFASCSEKDTEEIPLDFVKYTIDGQEKLNLKGTGITPEIRIYFSAPLDSASLYNAVKLFDYSGQNDLNIALTDNDSTLIFKPKTPLKYITKYDFVIDNQLKSKIGSNLSTSVQGSFSTKTDDTNKFPQLTDDELLTLVQRQTFRYFWDFGHPVSGLSRERNTSGDLVTSGGTGFGIMSIIVGIERGFITRKQGLDRLLQMTDFLLRKAERFHGVYPHWLNGATGKTIPFSTKDDGGDIVETSYLIAGLLCASEYFDQQTETEKKLRKDIKDIWESVEWNWYTKGNENVLYWHWSPQYNWEMNHQLKGWNEALITYILAAASPTYPIFKETYTKGWASNGAMQNGRLFYGMPLPLGPDLGGPLFFSHYSFLGIDPRNLKDQYADYWQQVVNHTKINYQYCVANPRQYYGYTSECWGLTASDTKGGYDAHSPTNDKGVITPTAALSSMPFTPQESIAAMRFFYYKAGDKIFKDYGFTDAFSLHHVWFADSFLAIDQGPIIVMIENYRSNLIWNITMKNKDIRNGLDKLGFTY
jgi:hypothetical protein